MPFQPLSYCLALLRKRLRSRKELEESLQRKGVEADDIASTLSTLEELKLVDDGHYARAYVRTRDRLSVRGEPVLRTELYLKGIDKSLIDQVLRERRDGELHVNEDFNEDEAIKDLIRGKERLYASLPKEIRERRLMAFLQRRGFSYESIRRILNA